MYKLFFGILEFLDKTSKIKKLALYSENFADFTVEKDGQLYVVSIRKEEQNDVARI
jgi:hypothetical protein